MDIWLEYQGTTKYNVQFAQPTIIDALISPTGYNKQFILCPIKTYENKIFIEIAVCFI